MTNNEEIKLRKAYNLLADIMMNSDRLGSYEEAVINDAIKLIESILYKG